MPTSKSDPAQGFFLLSSGAKLSNTCDLRQYEVLSISEGTPPNKASLATIDAVRTSHQQAESWQRVHQKADKRIEHGREKTGEILTVSIFYFERDFFDTLRRILTHMHTPKSQFP